MSPILVLAEKEFRDGLRNKWVAGATLLLAALAFALTFLGSSPAGLVEAKPLAVTVVSISSLTIFLIPLIALLIGYDAIVGESERGCLLLMLTYPVSRGQIMLGKFLGHATILTVATLVGYGAAGLAAAMTGNADAESWRAFSALLGSSVLLGLAFLALAYLACSLPSAARQPVLPLAYGSSSLSSTTSRLWACSSQAKAALARMSSPRSCSSIPPMRIAYSISPRLRTYARSPAWADWLPARISVRPFF